MEQLYRWVKASEREPEATNGYAKDIVYRVHRDSGTRLMVCTVNQLLDTLKYRIKEKYEWLEPIEESEQDYYIDIIDSMVFSYTWDNHFERWFNKNGEGSGLTTKKLFMLLIKK